MTPEAWLWIAVGLVLLLLVWTAWLLTRLRRLERRVARAWTALDTQLQRRAGLAEQLAHAHPSVLGEVRAAALAACAADARSPGDRDRENAENLLGRKLRELPADLAGLPTALREDLNGTATRVVLARRFYNDAVRDLRDLRGRRLPRLLRLHTRHPLPRFFDIDDRIDGVANSAGGAGR